MAAHINLHTFLTVLAASATVLFQVSSGFDWEASSPQDETTIYAYPCESVTFPWKFSTAVDERVIYVEWHMKTDGDYQIIATSVAGFFMKLPTANFSIDFLPNAGIQISNFTSEDYGSYGVSVIYKVNGTLYSESSSVVLELPDAPALEGNRLSVQMQQQPIADDITGEPHVQLSCGTFLTLGSSPLSMEWETPSGTVLPSSSYSNGTFYLNLPNPVVGGTYVCRPKDPSLVAGCMINNLSLTHGDYVLVDAVHTRLMLLEGSVRDLHDKDSSVDAELHRQEDVDNNLSSGDERLTSLVDDLQQELVQQKKVDDKQNSEITHLYEELASQKETEVNLTVYVTEIQGQIIEQGTTDDEQNMAIDRLNNRLKAQSEADAKLSSDLANIRQEHTSSLADLHRQVASNFSVIQGEIHLQAVTDDKLTSDLSSLREQHVSDLDDILERLASGFGSLEEKLELQNRTDEELKTELQSEQGKVNHLEAQITEMKTLGLKELLQQREAKRIEDEFTLKSVCEQTRFQSSCYSVLTKIATWSTANDECKRLGGKLAEIESAEESNHVKKLAKDFGSIELWLGGTDTGKERTWKWASSGSVFSFTDWGYGEPNNAHGGEDCLTMANALSWTWNDAKCYDLESGAVCEFRSPF